MNMLKSYLLARGIRQIDFAEELGIKQPTVSRLASGKIVPSLGLAVEIERATNRAVPVSCWAEIKQGGAT